MKKFKYKHYTIEVEDAGDLKDNELKKCVLDAVKQVEHSEHSQHAHDEHSHECCICGKHFEEWGNDPWGSLDKDGKQINWKEDDYCCDECNSKYVLPGRLHTMGIVEEFTPVPEMKKDQ